MAYSQSKKLTDTEKKLQALKIQLFGKERQTPAIAVSHKSNIIDLPSSITISSHQNQDSTYLKKDLLKIITLALIAFATQIILYLQFTFKILKFS